MNIEEIRAEIPKAFGPSFPGECEWIIEHGKPDFDKNRCYGFETNQTAARILVDMAYEAGVKRGGEISISALNEAELHENPMYQKGYEAGKAEIPECLECKSGDYEKGFKAGKAEAIVVPDNAAIAKADHEGFERGYGAAAKDPKAWYVLDKNGKQVHIGDKVKLTNNETVHVQGLGSCAIFAVPRGHGYTIFETDYFEKVIPDTRKKIKDELSDAIWYGWSECEIGTANNPEELAEQFISRIEELEVD